MKHGLHGTKFWRVYVNMVNRCTRKNIPAYKKYGAKGVLCKWISFEEFRDDMYESYLSHVEIHGEYETTIERMDPNGNYCKENCRWATWKEQSRNKRNSKNVLFDGKVMTVADVAEKIGKPYEAVYNRVLRGKDLEKPYRDRERLIAYNGQEKTINAWAYEYGLTRQMLYSRLFYKGWSVERALNTPPHPTITKSSKVLEFRGEKKTLTQWAKQYGLKPATLFARLKKGVPIEDALHGKVLSPSEAGRLATKR